MKSVKSFAVILMALLMLTVNVIASDVLIPNEVIMGTLDDYKTIEKVYVLPGDSDENIIPKEGFTESDVEYVFEEMKVVDNSEEDTKEYVENINYHTSTNDAEAVIALFSPTIEVSTEDGYIGVLAFDHSTLELTPAGYSTALLSRSTIVSQVNLWQVLPLKCILIPPLSAHTQQTRTVSPNCLTLKQVRTQSKKLPQTMTIS